MHNLNDLAMPIWVRYQVPCNTQRKRGLIASVVGVSTYLGAPNCYLPQVRVEIRSGSAQAHHREGASECLSKDLLRQSAPHAIRVA